MNLSRLALSVVLVNGRHKRSVGFFKRLFTRSIQNVIVQHVSCFLFCRFRIESSPETGCTNCDLFQSRSLPGVSNNQAGMFAALYDDVTAVTTLASYLGVLIPIICLETLPTCFLDFPQACIVLLQISALPSHIFSNL